MQEDQISAIIQTLDKANYKQSQQFKALLH